MLMRYLTVVLTLLLCLVLAGTVQAQSGNKTSPGTGTQPNPTIGGQGGPGSTVQNPTIGGQATNPQNQTLFASIPQSLAASLFPPTK